MSVPHNAIFISYRRADSVYAVDQLDERLKQAFGSDAVFRDASSIEPGSVFPDRIRRALDEARVAMVVIGPWWLRVTVDPNNARSPRRIDDPGDWVRIEIETLLRRDGVAVIPLLLGGANIPESGDLPPSLQALPDRNAMSLRPYPDFEHSVRLVIEAIAKLLDVTPQPFGPPAQAATETPPRVAATRLSVTGRKFVGREKELHLLDEAWGRSAQDKINIVSLIGQGGEGKTAIVLEWYARRAHHGWQGARRVFDWSFYSQGTNAQSAASADEFFGKAFTWFGHTGEVPRDPWTKGERLAELIAAERTLLVLDGIEPLQQPPGEYGGEFKDPATKALLRALALRNPGLCILTSRTDITDLKDFEHAEGSCVRHPLHSLDAEAARQLLRDLGVRGPDRELDEAIAWFKGHAYDLNLLGNYLAQCTSDHEIRRWKEILLLKEDDHVHGQLDASGQKEGHGRRMLRAYERWLGPDTAAVAILRLLGLFDRPARSDLLEELRAAPVIPGLTESLADLPEDEWLRALDQLERLGLVAREQIKDSAKPVTAPSTPEEEQDDDKVPDNLRQLLGLGPKLRKAKRVARPVSYAVDTHPLLREHFAAELRSGNTEAWLAAHRRLYECLRDSTPDVPEPTLNDLQPLYQAVAHGCKAGLQQDACDEVYAQRISRGNEFYSSRKLGAFGSELGAVACFFEQPWSCISPSLTEAAQGWLLGQTAFRLRALGRLTEALEPFRTSMEMSAKQKEWEAAAIHAGNLSELELTLGEVDQAKGEAEQSVAYADRSGDATQRMLRLTTLAAALHQAGRRAEAEARFREAEELQAKDQPEYPLLYSLRGFQYCELLLAAPERAAWQHTLQLKTQNSELKNAGASCLAVEQRAAKTLKWIEDHGLDFLSPSLDHLTLGRVSLYRAILEKSEVRSAKAEVDQAVAGLRRAGTLDHLPQGILTRAWLRYLEGDADGSRADLDEAWEIAERGPMRLHLADIHLHRARLFGRAKSEVGGDKYPWKSPQVDLASARQLIDHCGYWRRKEELEDAEKAILG